jgi:D-3-phosphoglycerate dehydrogenase
MTAAVSPAAGRNTPGRVFVFEQMDPTGKSLQWLREQGLDLTLGKMMWEPGFRRFTEDEIISAADGFVAVVGASGAHFTRRVIDALPALRFISKYGIGYESVDVDAATDHGVLVSNTPDDFNILAVAEHTITCILALKKRLLTWTPEFMRRGGWRGDVFAGYLSGSTVGIVGLGRIGRSVVERLAGWNVKVIAHDPYVSDGPTGVEMVDLPTLLRTSDVVTLHSSPRSDNWRMIDGAALAKMQRTAFLINTGRAWLVDYPALRVALQERRIAGAALDVFEVKPPDVDDALFRMDNVLATPHSAAWTFETLESMGWHGARNLWAMMNGEPAADVVNGDAVRARVSA